MSTPRRVRRAVARTLAVGALVRLANRAARGGDPPEFYLAPFGKVPVPGAATSAVVGVEALAGLLRRVMTCASRDECRPQLCAVLLQSSPPRLRAVATDGHRMAVADGASESGSLTPFEVLLPLAQVKRLLAFAAQSRKKLTLKLVPEVGSRNLPALDGQPPCVVHEVEALSVFAPDGSRLRLAAALSAFPPYEDIFGKLRLREGSRVHAGYVVDALAPAARAKGIDNRFVDVWVPNDLLAPVVFQQRALGFTCVVMPARKG